jgi:hypothetical protein
MTEGFKTIEDFPNYKISAEGTIINSRGKNKTPNKRRDGYYKVDLYDDGIGHSKSIHRLVAEAFISNPDNKPDVNHKDGNKLNNSVENLEWVTKSENIQHAYRTGLNKPHPTYGMLGKKNPNGGRHGRKVRIVETGEEFNSVKDCAIAINGNDRAICDCLNGKQRSHRDYHFEDI